MRKKIIFSISTGFVWFKDSCIEQINSMLQVYFIHSNSLIHIKIKLGSHEPLYVR
jgi:hypothetical protein